MLVELLTITVLFIIQWACPIKTPPKRVWLVQSGYYLIYMYMQLVPTMRQFKKKYSALVFSRVHVTWSLVLCVMFCILLFDLLSFYFWPLCCLSFDLRILITHLVSSNNFRGVKQQSLIQSHFLKGKNMEPLVVLFNECHRCGQKTSCTRQNTFLFGLGWWFSTPPLSTIFQLYRGGQVCWWRKLEFPEKTTGPSHWQTLSHNGVSCRHREERDSNSLL